MSTPEAQPASQPVAPSNNPPATPPVAQGNSYPNADELAEKLLSKMRETFPANAQSTNAPASGSSNNDQLLTAIQALPETIVNAIKESTQPATPPAATENSSQQSKSEPGSRTLAQRWFGQ
jgi:hypothetical protein